VEAAAACTCRTSSPAAGAAACTWCVIYYSVLSLKTDFENLELASLTRVFKIGFER
jgi:hypothetical protein